MQHDAGPNTDSRSDTEGMAPSRLEAFTDGVVAIIITIMVLDLKVPESASWDALPRFAPMLFAYVLSYVNVGLYWANHHHLLSTARRVTGSVLWANLALLFWLSLVPFVIRWMDEAGVVPLTAAAYGVVLLLAGFSYLLLQQQIVRINGDNRDLAAALGRDRKGKLSLVGYVAAIALAFAVPWLSLMIYVAVAVVWLVPDRRIESRVGSRTRAG